MKISDFNLIDNLLCYYSQDVLDSLLMDRTTGRNIIWATDEYKELGDAYQPEREIKASDIANYHSGVIKPRIVKEAARQQERTRKKAEVFTPSWIVNKMCNAQDEAWFGYPDVFNSETESGWVTRQDPVQFPKTRNKTPLWKRYVDLRRLEITCGEAPFIASRYDATSGDMIPVADRIGMLDRKLRIVTENAADEKEWLEWAFRALEATYGYEFSGDNLLIARINVFLTFAEHLQGKWNRQMSENESRRAARIISWNLWQMDGLTGTVPFGKAPEPADDGYYQMTLFDLLGESEEKEEEPEDTLCRIYDWRLKASQKYVSLRN